MESYMSELNGPGDPMQDEGKQKKKSKVGL